MKIMLLLIIYYLHNYTITSAKQQIRHLLSRKSCHNIYSLYKLNPTTYYMSHDHIKYTPIIHEHRALNKSIL